MSLFEGVISVSGIAFFVMVVMLIAAVGYMLGRITIKGVSLGTAGVFIIALLFGALFYQCISDALVIKGTAAVEGAEGAAYQTSYASQALKLVENIGLVMFVTAVGFIAGPNFFKNLKKNFKSYIVLGLLIILSGGIACVACYFIGKGGESDPKEFVAMLVGLLSGSLTSTPAFSAAKDTVAAEYVDAVTVGHGIAYLFGVIGVVLFVQLIPKLVKADMSLERSKISAVDVGQGGRKPAKGKLIHIDPFGIGAFALAAIVGIIVGNIHIPLTSKGLSGTTFALTATGGTLLVSLIVAHFGRIGRISLMPDKKTLEVFRELGLMLFLIGAGVAGGASFVKYFKPIYFVYGVVMTIFPMVVGYLFAKYVLKLSLLNNLGSITGGMTSTPALGTLINVAGTDDVASAYAATYPIALIAVVLISQGLILLL